ncbi:hypothetical protein IJM86_01395 [bacterium]|nr:hypothetical protein [bacterium]
MQEKKENKKIKNLLTLIYIYMMYVIVRERMLLRYYFYIIYLIEMTENQMTKDYFEHLTYDRCDGPLCAICDIFFKKIKSSIRENFVEEKYFDTTFCKDGFKLKQEEYGGTNSL